jgi:hypothetical protein
LKLDKLFGQVLKLEEVCFVGQIPKLSRVQVFKDHLPTAQVVEEQAKLGGAAVDKERAVHLK